MPELLKITLSNLIYFEKSQLPQALANRLIRLAAFQNPEFFKAQAMRFTVWDKPRVIGCAENYPNYIALPLCDPIPLHRIASRAAVRSAIFSKP